MKENGGGDRCAGVQVCTQPRAQMLHLSRRRRGRERKTEGEVNQSGAWSRERCGALDAGTGPDWLVISHPVRERSLGWVLAGLSISHARLRHSRTEC